MPVGQLFIDAQAAPSDALARGATLPDLLTPEQPVALYCAALHGQDALVLGHYQLQSQALPPQPPSAVLRRSSGGVSVRTGEGILYAALALADRSSLMSCPQGRLLNRNVRGVLQGLRLLGAQANYFGRDFLSFVAQPAVFAAWDAADDGHVLLEFFISQSRSCFLVDSDLAYPPRREPALRGHTPVSLEEVQVTAPPQQVFEALAQGHTRAFGVAWQPGNLDAWTPRSDALDPSADTPEQRAMHWSTPREEAIGFVSAGVRLDGAGKFSAVRVAGDFLAHRACATTLERVLLGASPTSELVARAVDTAFARSGYDVEGIRSLHTFQEAILDAAATLPADPAR